MLRRQSIAVQIDGKGSAAQVSIISATGTGNKLDPTKLQVADIYETKSLARVMRRELRKRGVKALKVVCSTELPRKPLEDMPE